MYFEVGYFEVRAQALLFTKQFFCQPTSAMMLIKPFKKE
tara:strand:- start:209 stop:325 length:117 start_codon:yes stop_codon:yes gene_type:complete